MANASSARSRSSNGTGIPIALLDILDMKSEDYGSNRFSSLPSSFLSGLFSVVACLFALEVE
jgi:hypothetical protein